MCPPVTSPARTAPRLPPTCPPGPPPPPPRPPEPHPGRRLGPAPARTPASRGAGRSPPRPSPASAPPRARGDASRLWEGCWRRPAGAGRATGRAGATSGAGVCAPANGSATAPTGRLAPAPLPVEVALVPELNQVLPRHALEGSFVLFLEVLPPAADLPFAEGLAPLAEQLGAHHANLVGGQRQAQMPGDAGDFSLLRLLGAAALRPHQTLEARGVVQRRLQPGHHRGHALADAAQVDGAALVGGLDAVDDRQELLFGGTQGSGQVKVA